MALQTTNNQTHMKELSDKEKIDKAIQGLRLAKIDLEKIESEAPSINTARGLASDAIDEINECLRAVEDTEDKIIDRVIFAINRGHEPNSEDLEFFAKKFQELREEREVRNRA